MENWRKFLKEDPGNANLDVKKVVDRAFQIVRETGVLAGHPRLATASSMFRFGSSEYDIVIGNNTGEKEGTHTYASYKTAKIPNMHVLMPKANAKNPVKHTKETITVSAKYVNQISSNVISANKNLKKDTLIEIEVAAAMLAPVIAHELEHYRFTYKLLKGIFRPLDYEGTDPPSKHMNRIFGPDGLGVFRSMRKRYSSERSAISVMPDFQDVIVSNYLQDKLKNMPEEGRQEMFRVVDLEFKKQNKNAKSIVSNQDKTISNNQKAFKDTQPNLYKGWKDRYSYLMAKKGARTKDKIASK